MLDNYKIEELLIKSQDQSDMTKKQLVDSTSALMIGELEEFHN